MILSSEEFPSQWARGYIVPIYKSGPKDDPGNYRGITVSSCIGRLFTIILNNRVNAFIDQNSLLEREQIGFQKNCRTSDHIFVLRCLINLFKTQQ